MTDITQDDIAQLRDVLNILHPLMISYYKIKNITSKLDKSVINDETYIKQPSTTLD